MREFIRSPSTKYELMPGSALPPRKRQTSGRQDWVGVPAMLSPDASVARFSTEGLAPRERCAAWREAFGRGLLKADIEQVCEGPFQARATMRSLADIHLMSAMTSGVRYRRPPELLANDDLVFSFGAAKGSQARQLRRETVAEEGDALLMLGGEWSLVTRATEGRFDAIRLPRAMLAPVVRNVDDRYCRRIPADMSSLRLLRRYLAIVNDADVIATPALQSAAATHIVDLIALTLGATRDGAEMARGRGLRAARLHAVKLDIAKNLGRPDLSVAALARRHGLTPRNVQRLFEAERTTFTDYVLSQRLAHARRLLADPRRAREKVSTIAYDAGFADVSYFNRAFRRVYGDTPSGIRAGRAVN
ncbi:MAG: AraC family transcriptional regulator [Xanthobacteraceae bacterium]|nr:AraC family transcriptional regulator [Myxococcota bacterium]MCZ7660111.1 AraC family transcriptional regulator [Xanthobacteraceae bacterium]